MALAAARCAGHGLVIVAAGHDPAPAWRSPWLRRAVLAAVAVAAVALCAASVASIRGVHVGLFQLPHVRAQPGPGRALGLKPGRGSALPGFRQLSASQSAWTLAVVTALAVVAPLALGVRYPLMGWRVGWAALLVVPLTSAQWPGGWPWGPVQLLVLVVLLAAASVRQPRAALWWMWALSLIVWWLWSVSDYRSLSARALGAVAFTAVAVAVDALGARRRAQQALAGQAQVTELEQRRRAVLEERARIARELHDVVAHHLSLIAVRAETAPFRLAGLAEPVREEFGSLSGGAREALVDMRRLLGVLREDQPAERGPQPQLADLPALVESARRAGVAVELTAASGLAQVPAAVGVCAYRIVQESLSNAGRHAPGAAVTVSVEQGPDAVRLRVANGPGAAPEPPARPGPGHGLTGMRERVALLGGSLLADPSPDGGFVVSAVLPVGAAA
jgi:signal transduction histidine kinase